MLCLRVLVLARQSNLLCYTTCHPGAHPAPRSISRKAHSPAARLPGTPLSHCAANRSGLPVSRVATALASPPVPVLDTAGQAVH